MNSRGRLWIGTALLAASWLFGLDYFYPAVPWAWMALIAAAVAIVGQINASPEISRVASSRPLAVSHGVFRVDSRIASIVLFLPAVWFAPWPYRIAPLLIVLGLVLQLPPIRRRWAGWIAHGAVVCGVVLLVQALALELYAAETMRSHDLPWPLPDALAGIAGLLGIDAVADGSAVVMHSMRQVHRLAATWELLLDPATFLFFVGGLTMLALQGNDERGMMNDEYPSNAVVGAEEQSIHPSSFTVHHLSNWSAWISGLRLLTVVILAWLPVRAGLLMALYLHRVLRSDPDRPLHAMNHFFSPWMLSALLAVPVLLAWRFVRIRGRGTGGEGRGTRNEGDERFAASQANDAMQNTKCKVQNAKSSPPISDPLLSSPLPSPLSSLPRPSSTAPRPLLAAVCIALGAALFTAGIYWNPVGSRKGGRVMVVERHSRWSPTTKPYDTQWYAEPPLFEQASGYNYAAAYRWLGQYYEMSRLLDGDKIDDATLAHCDVLVIKIPTERYSLAEAAAVVRFVERGGGLLLIGDHTNFERSATAMNDMTRPMGFIFRDDLLFGFGKSPYDETYRRPTTPHPIVQYFPSLDFAVSCSIDPGGSRGRAAMVNTGLWSMGPEYHAENFHPVPQHCPEMRYGAFIQTWAAWHGRGRAVAFTDSTIFSNFCLGQPGKFDLLLGMIEWLNHANPLMDPRWWLLPLGLVPLAASMWLFGRGRDKVAGNRRADAWLVLLAAGAFGWVVASLAVAAAQRSAMLLPERVHPLTRVVIDRTTSAVPLAEGLFPKGENKGYGILEAWIPRLDCCMMREQGDKAFSGDVLVAICPSRSGSEEFHQKLEQYVAGGGKLLVIDTLENADSTANSLLWPFGLSVRRDRAAQGVLSTAAAIQLPAVDVAQACEVGGGQTIARIDAAPVAAVRATARVGLWPSASDRSGPTRRWAKPGWRNPAPRSKRATTCCSACCVRFLAASRCRRCRCRRIIKRNLTRI